MDLQTFIKETLIQIANGVAMASPGIKEKGGMVNPRNVGITIRDGKPVYEFYDDKTPAERFSRAAEIVDFDVAISATEGTETKGGIGIMVGAIGLGTHGKSDAENSTESRVRFRIPIVLPNG